MTINPLQVFTLNHLRSICGHAETPTSLVEGKSLDEHAHFVRHRLSQKGRLMESNKLFAMLCLESL